MSTYAAIIEGRGRSFSAYVPDLPGCAAASDFVEEVERLIREPMLPTSAESAGAPRTPG